MIRTIRCSGHLLGGGASGGVSASGPGGVCLWSGVSASDRGGGGAGVSASGLGMSVSVLAGVAASGLVGVWWAPPGQTPPRGQIDTCENITFPQLR